MALTRSALQARRKVLDKQIAEHEAAIGVLRQQLADLDAAERVMEFLGSSDTVFEPVAQISEKPAVQVVKNSTWRSTHPNRGGKGKFRNRPDGSPSNAQIIMDALNYAFECGLIGFEPSDIVKYVQRRISPDYAVKAIPPTCWMMMKEGKIAKYGDLYGLLGQNSEQEEKSETQKSAERTRRLEILDEIQPLKPTEGL